MWIEFKGPYLVTGFDVGLSVQKEIDDANPSQTL
jgi:hypothetical protein